MAEKIISIITPTFKHTEYLRQAIASIISQQGDFYIDYIVQDGADDAQTLEIVKEFTQQLLHSTSRASINGLEFTQPQVEHSMIKCKGISIRYFAEKDRGMYDGLNLGLAKMVGDVWSYLNDDDIYYAGCFAEVLGTFAAEPGVGVVYGNAEYIDGMDKVIGRYGTEDVASADLRSHNFLSQPSVFIKAAVYEQVGGFNANFKTAADYEYWLRLFSKGFKFRYINQTFSATRVHSDTKTLGNRSVVHLETLAIIKHYGGRPDMNVFAEFLMGLSLFGRVTAKFVGIENPIRRSFLKVMSGSYLRKLSTQVAEMEQKLFNKE